ncbi:hypothetical protein ACMFGU_18270 [Morganella morganii]|uniref:hypothetical protein n=1 Tax=Morganella morganii TaxID=582 RepID=UPI000DD64B63|nr:hypothetical protein [Morganella morganii]
MSATGGDFFDFACDCMKLGTEIGYRNAIGRSYYGLYHEVCAAMKNCPPTSHQGVAEYLQHNAWKGNEPYSKSDLRVLGIVLQQQHSKRKWSDYDLVRNITENDALESIKTVQKMMDKLSDMKKMCCE